MFDALHQLISGFGLQENYAKLVAWFIVVIFILLLSWISNYVAKHYIVSFIRSQLTRSQGKYIQIFGRHNIFHKISHLAPAIVIYLCIPLISVDDFPSTALIAHSVRILTQIYFIVIIFLIASTFLTCVDDIYSQLSIARRRPIKSYLQVVKLFLFATALIIIISIALNKSPVAFLTGLGALTAILMLVFRDTILGFVASIQLATYDMVRIGDWIEMSEFGADGDVIDMSLNTIKIRNFDNTIITIPTYSLMTNGVKNWRGMSESGGRRIKRSIYIDVRSIRFCKEEDTRGLSQIKYMNDFIQNKIEDINAFNQATENTDRTLEVNGRNLTNIGLFRNYLEIYLREHSDINQNMTLMVRQLAPTEHGLPIEIYVFTNTTNWVKYEHIQADIFDHILASIHYFDLRLYQSLSEIPMLKSTE